MTDHDDRTDQPGEDDGTAFRGHADGSLDALALQQLLLATDTVQDFLDQLVARAAAATGHHCGITVAPRGVERGAYTVASSDDLTHRLDELQYANDDGPCLQALRTATVVSVADFDGDPRWPGFLPEAVKAGARSSMSYPLSNDGATIGVINYYGETPVPDDDGSHARAEELVAPAASVLALALRLGQRQDMIENLRAALTSRSIIDQAIGIVMAQQRCSGQAAFELLRTASQHRNAKLREVAAGIVAAVQGGAPGAPSGRY